MSDPGRTLSPWAATGFHRAGSLADFDGNDRLAVTINGTSVVIFKVKGSFVATPAVCPHAGGPLCDATVDGEALSCAWHGYSFSLRTGECDDDPDLNLERFEVRVDGGDLWIKL